MLRASFATAAVVIALTAVSASAGQFHGFHTPGGNIGCVVFTGPGTNGGGARCDIARRRWRAPQKPASCHLDYGNGLIVGAHGAGEFTCAGDTVLRQGFVLYTGGFVEAGPYKCASLGSAVRCINRDTHHGFKISRTAERRF